MLFQTVIEQKRRYSDELFLANEVENNIGPHWLSWYGQKTPPKTFNQFSVNCSFKVPIVKIITNKLIDSQGTLFLFVHKCTEVKFEAVLSVNMKTG